MNSHTIIYLCPHTTKYTDGRGRGGGGGHGGKPGGGCSGVDLDFVCSKYYIYMGAHTATYRCPHTTLYLCPHTGK
jgi:hypothetical protein